MTRDRWLALLYATTALLHLLPIWRVQYIPTVDGPSHVYNAVVMRELAAGSPEMQRVFRIDARPSPNWMSHAMLRLALTVASPLVAEKLVLSIIVLLFLGGLWMLGRVYAFLAMPLVYSLLMQMGSYNFMLATALMMFAVALWWREAKPIALAILLIATYFAHPIPTAVALLFIGVASLALRRRILATFAALTPATLLLGWFALQPSAEQGVAWSWKGTVLWQPLTRMLLLLTFDLRQLTFGTVSASSSAC
ncbi:MAG TPA: hypothetical protein VGQ76_00475 [Thermoanaerobaculia bacterium]|jgi:hypothetical protein|nr:hypothetical protein [Thermoanaerobaculia bacterium]